MNSQNNLFAASTTPSEPPRELCCDESGKKNAAKLRADPKGQRKLLSTFKRGEQSCRDLRDYDISRNKQGAFEIIAATIQDQEVDYECRDEQGNSLKEVEVQ